MQPSSYFDTVTSAKSPKEAKMSKAKNKSSLQEAAEKFSAKLDGKIKLHDETHCHKCGSDVAKDDNYCMNCGVALLAPNCFLCGHSMTRIETECSLCHKPVKPEPVVDSPENAKLRKKVRKMLGK